MIGVERAVIQRVRLSDGDINQAMSGENDDAEDPTTQRKSSRNEEDESAALGKERSRKQEHASYDDAEEEELREVEDAGRKQKHSVDSSLSEMKTRLKGKQDDDEQTTGKSAGPQKVAPVKATTRASPSKPRKVLLGSDEILKDYRFDHKRVHAQAPTTAPAPPHTHTQGKLDSFSFNCAQMLVEVEVKVGMADKKLLMISLVEALVASFVVKQVDGIKRAFVIVRTSSLPPARVASASMLTRAHNAQQPPPNGQTQYAVQTEGVNFGIIAQFADVVDLSGVRSNDIYAVLTTFGVEAARRSIADEINGVFKVCVVGPCVACGACVVLCVLCVVSCDSRCECACAGLRYWRGSPSLGDHRRLHDVRGRLQALQPGWHEHVHVALPEDVLRNHHRLPRRRHHVR